MIRRLASSFAPRAFPPLTRRNYRYELTSVCFTPAAVACVEGGVAGVIASKLFGAGSLAIACISAAPALSNILSFLWVRLCQGRDRVQIIAWLQLGVLLCVGAIAFAPVSSAGAMQVVAAVMVARFLLAGVIVARADLWRANYPRTSRGRAVGKLTTVMTLIMGLSGLGVALAMDHVAAPELAFRTYYLTAMGVGLVGIVIFTRIRWRGRAAQIASELRLNAERSAPVGTKAMIHVLRDDQLYRKYMVAQFVLGFANLAAIPTFIIALDDVFTLAYVPSILLTHVLPVLVPIAVIPLWAKLLDGSHIIRFRAVHSWFFVAANALMGVGLLLEDMPTLFLARIVLGVAFGGGMLAWNLGHYDFATRELANVYMGIHATLTGVRGAVAPFVGAAMFSGVTLTIGRSAVGFPGMGGWAFIVLAACSAVGAMLFVRMRRDIAGRSGAPTER